MPFSFAVLSYRSVPLAEVESAHGLLNDLTAYTSTVKRQIERERRGELEPLFLATAGDRFGNIYLASIIPITCVFMNARIVASNRFVQPPRGG
jgi:hypothetical protein